MACSEKAISRTKARIDVGANPGFRRSHSTLSSCQRTFSDWRARRDILKYERLVVMKPSIEVIEKIWALPADKREPSVWSQARQAVRAQAQEANRG